MDGLEQLAHDLRGFAAEVHTLGYSRSVVSGAEHRFIELSERMIQRADDLAAVESAVPPLLQQSGTG
jgi:DNA-binding MltR family transcriptional regulator